MQKALLLAASLAAVSACTPGGAARERPNLVLVVIDTLRADKLGSYGASEDTSPEIDALAREGVRFHEVLAPSSWTRASLAGLLTGIPPRSLGIYDERRDALDDRFATLAEVLWTAGYRTFGATANPNVNRSFGFGQGFDHYADSNVLWRWMPDEPGKTDETREPVPAARDVYAALLERLAEDERRPFYAQVVVMEVHEHEHPERRPGSAADAALFPGHPEGDYLRAVRQASRELDGFVRAVEALRGGRNTLFAITSDHGEGLGDHPGVGGSTRHGLVLYESNLRVPLVLYHPGDLLPRGVVVETPVQLLDVAATLLDLLGVEPPPGSEGVSLVPWIRGEEPGTARPEVFFSETRFRGQNKLAASAPGWRYIENRDGHRGTSPRALHRRGRPEDGARTDVTAEAPEVAARLEAALRQWEESHPAAPPTRRDAPLSIEEMQQLQAIGYGQ